MSDTVYCDNRAQREPDPALNALSERVIGAAIEVHRALGPGLLESVYEEALCVELTLRNIPFTRQPSVDLHYKGQAVGSGRLDLLIDGRLVVELKAVEVLRDMFQAQVISYLRATGIHLGLIINFNVSVLTAGIKRIVCT